MPRFRNPVVSTADILDGSITAAKLADGAVTTPKIGLSAVTEGKLADLAVAASKLADSAVSSAKIADLAVEAAKLADSAVTSTKIANAAVGTAAIANAAVGTAAIANAAITNAKIANLAVGTAEIADAAITDAKINDLSATKITAGNIRTNQITVGPTAGSHIVINSQLGDTNIASDNYVSGVSGWKIFSNGSAEFRDVTARGVVESSLFRTAATGERLEIRGNDGESFLRFYNSSDTQIGSMGFIPSFGSGILTIANDTGISGGITLDAAGPIRLIGGSLTNRVSVEAAGDFSNVSFRVVNGSSASVFEVSNSGDVHSGDGSTGAPAHSFIADADTGAYSPASDVYAVAAGGVEKLRLAEGAFSRMQAINDTTTGSGANVFVNSSNGVIARSTSSKRYKTAIRPWDRRASVLDLTPSLYRSRLAADDGRRARLGLIAEDVAEGFPLAAVVDEEGRPDAIDWPALTTGLLAELADLERRVADLEAA